MRVIYRNSDSKGRDFLYILDVTTIVCSDVTGRTSSATVPYMSDCVNSGITEGS